MIEKSLFFNLGAVLVCFISFFVSQGVKDEKVVSIEFVDVPVIETNRANLSNIQKALSGIDDTSDIEVIVEADELRIRMYTGKMFRVSRAELSREAQTVLKEMSKQLRANMPSHIHIEGHTDDEPTDTPQYPNNWYLSSARAIAVGRLFIDETDMKPHQVTAQGFGASKPLDTEKSARIEIVVTP